MNENEARAIFTPTDFPLQTSNKQIICITTGRNGAEIYSQNQQLSVPGIEVDEFDPTGAGDTFAGTFLAEHLQHSNIEASAKLAIQRSAQVITHAGPYLS
jgi:sugar/nucleoside kinase (ribokinase family)